MRGEDVRPCGEPSEYKRHTTELQDFPVWANDNDEEERLSVMVQFIPVIKRNVPFIPLHFFFLRLVNLNIESRFWTGIYQDTNDLPCYRTGGYYLQGTDEFFCYYQLTIPFRPHRLCFRWCICLVFPISIWVGRGICHGADIPCYPQTTPFLSVTLLAFGRCGLSDMQSRFWTGTCKSVGTDDCFPLWTNGLYHFHHT